MTPERYSQEDDDLIRKYYPIEGADVVARLNVMRTRNAIKTRAAVLRVCINHGNGKGKRKYTWTSELEGVLISKYHLIGPVGCFHALDGRFSIISIKSKAKRFNLKAPKPERNYLADKEPIGECEDEYPIVQRWVQQWDRPQVERPASIFRMAA